MTQPRPHKDDIGPLHSKMPDAPIDKHHWPWKSPISSKENPTNGQHLLTITLVTPSFNQGIFIERTIRSVLLQDYPKLEYMVIDGNSTDGTLEVLEKYNKYLNYWVSEDDLGQADAVNKGFRRSSGEILAWLNSDDTLQPGALLKVGEFFAANPNVDVLYGDSRTIDKNEKPIRDYKEVAFNRRALEYGFVNIQQSSVFWRKELMSSVGFLDSSLQYAMDNDLFVRFSRENAKFKHLPEILSNYRIHVSSKTQSLRETVHEENQMVRFRLLGLQMRGIKHQSWMFFFKARKLILLLVQQEYRYVIRTLFG